jgi:hypothetical protein
MRSARFGLLLSILLLNVSVSAQQTQQATTPTPAPKDPQAVSVVTQALNAAGGATAITAIADFASSGTVTYYSGPNPALQGTVTIRGKGFTQFRIDTTLPSGTRSECTNGFTTMKQEDGSTQELHTQPPLYPVRLALPTLQLSAALTSPGLSLAFKGTVDLNGSSAYDIQVQRAFSGTMDPNSLRTMYLTVDYFIDVSTAHVVMMQDTVPKGSLRQIRYSDFRMINGQGVPFSISETIEGQTIRVIHLNQISFNSGLQESDFQL